MVFIYHVQYTNQLMCLSQVSGRKLAARDLPGAWERHRAGRTELRPVGSQGPPPMVEADNMYL